MPFVCYGFDKRLPDFEQNGIFNNYRESNEVTCILHVDLWKCALEGLEWIDAWIDEGYYKEGLEKISKHYFYEISEQIKQ